MIISTPSESTGQAFGFYKHVKTLFPSADISDRIFQNNIQGIFRKKERALVSIWL